MGINKLSENGQTQTSILLQEGKSKVSSSATRSQDTKLSLRSSKTKYESISKKEKLSDRSNVTGTYSRVGTSATINPEYLHLGFNFRWDSIDELTGLSFDELAMKSFEKGRPYCFAVAIASVENNSDKKRVFMDGSCLVGGVDDDSFEVPYKIALNSGKIAVLHDIYFFAAREDKSIEKICSIAEAIHGPNSMILKSFIEQEDNEVYESVGDVTNILISSAYYLGVGVREDRSYAEKVMPKLEKEEKEELSPDVFTFALANGKDTRLMEFLMDNGFDPNIKDPYEGSTSIQIAIYNKNQAAIRVFERYGYHV